MNPTQSPLATELFRQWQRARGSREGSPSRAFSRGWEDLLEAAGLVTATDRADAERDARALESRAWLTLKSERYHTRAIARVAIPLHAEDSWMTAFGFVRPDAADLLQIREFPWVPAMEFVREMRGNMAFEDLRRLNDFLKTTPRDIVPIKERSLEIFGDEKRFDAIVGTALFRDGRLDLRRDFFCEQIGAPLAWKRGPLTAANRPILIIENAATWHSFFRWNQKSSEFSAIVYGEGNRVIEGTRYLGDLFEELGGERTIVYFGDIDPQGLVIPQEASKRCEQRGWSAIQPFAWAYQTLLEIGIPQPSDVPIPQDALCDWLGEHAEAARRLLASGQRIAQEHMGWELLSKECRSTVMSEMRLCTASAFQHSTD